MGNKTLNPDIKYEDVDNMRIMVNKVANFIATNMRGEKGNGFDFNDTPEILHDIENQLWIRELQIPNHPENK